MERSVFTIDKQINYECCDERKKKNRNRWVLMEFDEVLVQVGTYGTYYYTTFSK